MKIYKAYKFRMYPNLEQQIKLNQNMGASRFIYNLFLEKKTRMYKEHNINLALKDMKGELPNLYSSYKWLNDVDKTLLRTSLEDLDRAFTNYYEKRSSYPKFKCKNNNDSYRTNCIYGSYYGNNYTNIKVNLDNRTIKLPKITSIKIKGYRKLNEFNKKILSASISKEGNKYYVSVLVEEIIIEKEYTLNSAIGIDIGIKNIVTTSDGEKYEPMINIKRLEKKIKGLNKWLSRTKKGSKNRIKVINKIKRVYQKIRNIRKYYIHKVTSKLVRENDLIVIENLQVKSMIENSNKRLTKLLTHSCFYEIIRQIKYKCKWNFKKIIQISTYYASSQICTHCGYKNEKLKDLNVRSWECPNCKNENDRDYNASINILNEGIIKYYKEQYAK